MSRVLGKFLLYFLIASLFCFLVVLGLNKTVLVDTIHKTVNSILLFHFGVTVLILVQLYLFNLKFSEHLGFIFLGMITFKLVLIGFYLAPHITHKVTYSKDELILFAIPYFVFLTFEVYFTKLLLDKKI